MTPVVLDLIIATIILLSIIIAYVRGLIREVFTIVALAAAAVGSWKGGYLLIPVFNNWLGVKEDGGEKAAEIVSEGAKADSFSSEAVQATVHKGELILGIMSPALAAKVAAYGASFAVVFILVSLISFSLTHGVNQYGLGVVDRLLGGAFGFARGFLLVFMFYVPWTFLIDQDKFPTWARNSYSVPVLQQAFVYADEQFGLTEKIQDRGGKISIDIDKVDPDDIGKGELTDAEKELQEALTREDTGRAGDE